MPAKLVQVNIAAITGPWNTLPGNVGSLDFEAGEIDDTIFGQTFQSNESGIIGWNVNANARYKGFAGYLVDLKKNDVSTSMTTEAMGLVSGKIFQITDVSKEVFDYNTTMTVFDNAIDETSNVESFDFLFGRITFKDAYSVNEPVTITGNYWTTKLLATANAFTLTQTADAVETTDFDTAQTNGGFRTFQPGLRQVALETSGFYNLTNAMLADLLNSTELLIEINPDGAAKSLARGYFRAVNQGQSGDVGALEDETVSFLLNVPTPAQPLQRPFGWQHENDTTLNLAIQEILGQWEAEAEIFVQYLSDGLVGEKGTAIVTDVSLTSGIDDMNEFACSFMGVGATTTV